MAKTSGTTRASRSSSPRELATSNGGGNLKQRLNGLITVAQRYSSEREVQTLTSLRDDIASINTRSGIISKIEERLTTYANYTVGGVDGVEYKAVRDFANSYLTSAEQDKVFDYVRRNLKR